MAKKRLNKKVAIMGSTILAVFLLGVVVIVLRFSKNPSKFLADAQMYLEQYDYDNAERNYKQAFGSAKDDDLKIEILLKISELHLTDDKVHEHEPDWIKAIGCWNSVINIDPKNIEARMALLKYFYEIGDSGNYVVWPTVETTASELAEVIDEKLLKPDPYVLLAKARAKLEMAKSGQTSDRESVLAEAAIELEQLKELTPENVDIYKYLAQAETVKGEIGSSKGQLGAAQKAADKAGSILERAIDILPDNIDAYVNLLDMKLRSVWEEVGSNWRDNEKVQALEGDFKSLVDKFGSDAKAYAALARFYQLDIRDVDKALETIEKAVELENQDINYAMTMAELYYRKFSIYEQEDFLPKALETAKKALDLPGARDVQGPRQFRHRQNKYMLYRLLAGWCIEQAFEESRAGNEDKRLEWTAKAEQAIHEIEQIIGTRDNVHIIKWHGMLALVKGDVNAGIRQMFSAYEQLKAAGQRDLVLSYMLAKVFENREEIGARYEFLESAILERPSIVLQKPQMMLDYAEVLTAVRATVKAIAMIDAYEQVRPATDRSKRIRILAYIRSGQFDDAEAQLAQLDADAVETIELKLALVQSRINRITAARSKRESKLLDKGESADAALNEEVELKTYPYQSRLRQLREQLIAKRPEQLDITIALCNEYVLHGQIDRARALISKYLGNSRDNAQAQLYKRRLDEPDPTAVSQERLNQITEEVIAGIGDEQERFIKLGQYYQSRGMTDEALEAYKKAKGVATNVKQTVGILFDAALSFKNMALAEQLVQEVRSANLDDCEGNLFSARLEIAKGNYQTAFEMLNNCLKMRPVFPNGYLLRSQVAGNIGNYDDAVSDAKMARRFNPTDPAVVKQEAAVLYNRYLRLGKNATSDQIAETEQALLRAVLLNQGDGGLRSIYAEFISERDPAKALAARQRLLKSFPNVENSLMLGNMAMRMALEETEEQRRIGLLDMAGSAYAKAYEMAPANKAVLNAYSEYLRLTGRRDEATKLFTGQDDSLWQFYLRDGQYDKAGDILSKLYHADPANTAVVRGLALIAVRTEDKEALKKYTEELLALENTLGNELMQIQSYLEVGLVNEAQLKLASFRERNPDNAKGILLEAWSAMAGGQLKKALELVNQNLEVNPESAVAWRLRGQVNRLLGDFNQAVEDLQKSKNIETDPEIRMELATAYRRVGRVTAAIGELVAALKNQQAPPRVRTMLEQLYLQTGRPTELKQFYEETLQKYPDSGLWNYHAGRFALQEKRYEDAEQLLLKSWEISETQGGYSQVLDKYLETLWQGEKYDELLKYAGKYIDTKFAPVVYSQMAQTRFMMGSKAAAMDYYRKAIEKCGTDDTLILGVLRNMSNIVGQSEVTKWCNEKLRTDPESMAANLMMFKLTQQRGEYNKALMYIDKFLSLVDPESTSWIEQMFNKANTLTMAYMKTSDKQYLSTAVLEFEKILTKQPDNTSVLNNLAYFLADNNEQLDKAVECAKRAHETSPNDASIMDTYAYALCKVGDYAKAEEMLQMAIQIFERESTAIPWDVYKHLGMAQEGLGQKAGAAGSYRQAMEVAGRGISEKNKEELMEAMERVLR